MTGDVCSRNWVLLAVGGAMIASTLEGCGRPTPQAKAPGPDPSGYLSPPTLAQAVGLADGGATLAGRAPMGSTVRLRSPDGAAYDDAADPNGDWSISLPPSEAPRMFAFEAETQGRDLHGEGAVLVSPSPEAPAFLMRSGFGATPIGHGGALALSAIDYDGGGGGAVSGFAAPGASVRFILDGQPVGEGQGDKAGRFAVLDLNTRFPLSPGPHLVRVESRGQAVEAQMSVSQPDTGASAFRATKEGDAWRIDWRLPAGGVQTTLVFTAPHRPTA